jgi:ankyrin repeat protein
MMRAVGGVLTGLLIATVLSAAEPEKSAGKIDFQRDVVPLLVQHCVDCHGPDLQMAELRLDQRKFVLGEEANPDLIKPGKGGESLFIQRLLDRNLGLIMPPTFPFFPGEKPGLPESSIAKFKAWIDQGAQWPEGVSLSSSVGTGSQSDDSRALFAAIRAGDHKSVRMVLAKNHDAINARDSYGDTPLMHAAAYSDTAMLALLLDAKADVNAANVEGATPLIRAASDFEKTKLLLERGASIEARSKLGRTALIIASSSAGNRETVKLLLARGAQITDRDQNGETCLTCAAKRGDTAMVELLLENGADITAASGFGQSALDWSAEASSLPTVALLLKHGGEKVRPHLNAALMAATTRGPDDLIRLLVEQGANPNFPTPLAGYTPLMLAAYSENVSDEAIRYLLAKGGDPKVRGANGETALSLAKKRGRTKVVELLEPNATAAANPSLESSAVSTDAGSIRAAAEKSLALLQSCGPTFFERSGCIACHQQSVTSVAVAEARKQKLKVNEPTAREQLQITALVGKGYRERFLELIDHPAASAPSVGYIALGMSAEDYPAGDYTDPMIVAVAGRQHQDGCWTAFGHRPPLEYSRISATALAVRALQLYSPPGLKDQHAKRIERARQWLLAAEPTTNSDRVFRLLGLSWVGATDEPVASETKALLKGQNADGGWSQFSTLPSDAYATGLVLFGLGAAGQVKPSDEAYQRGVAFLLRTQLSDGSWYVKTRSFPFQPYFESGFPHGHDQWISASATGFATVALIKALPEKAATSPAE